MKTDGRKHYLTRSVERALAILKIFTAGESEIGLTEISTRTGLH